MLLGAMLLGSFALAQTAPAPPRNAAHRRGVNGYGARRRRLQATETGIGKGRQQLRDIPQSVTVVTEKLIDDRNLDTLKEALKNTAGISFQAAEGGEEDIRLRGFSLATTGDIYIDGMRDPAFYDRDTFNLDRLELLRGSASMLFGRGSTGGAVNQVSKVPRLIDEHQVDVTVGSYNYRRVVGDFNLKTDDSAALRLNVMDTKADKMARASLDKSGGGYRGIGERTNSRQPVPPETTTASTTACRGYALMPAPPPPKRPPCRSTRTATTARPATTTRARPTA
jgi:catecholate siderophore receptor